MIDGATITVTLGGMLSLGSVFYYFVRNYTTKEDVKETEKSVREDMAELSARCDRLEATQHMLDKTHAVLSEQLKGLTTAVTKLDQTLDSLRQHILAKGESK